MLIITQPCDSGHEEAFVLQSLVSVYAYETEVIARIGAEDYEVLGRYGTEERAREVYAEIVNEYARHLYSDGGPMLTTDAYAPAFGFTPPKVYPMPVE